MAWDTRLKSCPKRFELPFVLLEPWRVNSTESLPLVLTLDGAVTTCVGAVTTIQLYMASTVDDHGAIDNQVTVTASFSVTTANSLPPLIPCL